MKDFIFTRTFSLVIEDPTINDLRTTTLPTVELVKKGKITTAVPPRYFPLTADQMLYDVTLFVCNEVDDIRTFLLEKWEDSPLDKATMISEFRKEDEKLLCCYILECVFKIPNHSFAWTSKRKKP